MPQQFDSLHPLQPLAAPVASLEACHARGDGQLVSRSPRLLQCLEQELVHQALQLVRGSPYVLHRILRCGFIQGRCDHHRLKVAPRLTQSLHGDRRAGAVFPQDFTELRTDLGRVDLPEVPSRRLGRFPPSRAR